ncbi:hypothetical protein B6N60_03254 [Richelia sinica FACHB-800]|uniref:Uncharacterized protein n=1 Tax=Richelia sinica FACHB-800 TaxID=1357546 RepID=A0A975T9K3_9NOST|nr:hypothetical protein B6N60_03254 [Richelia sinica FACHB-800]
MSGQGLSKIDLTSTISLEGQFEPCLSRKRPNLVEKIYLSIVTKTR